MCRKKQTFAEKQKLFVQFSSNIGPAIFNEFFKETNFLNGQYGSNVSNHTNFGTFRNNTFAAFWGARPYDSEIKYVDNAGNIVPPYRTALIEKGASLIYTLMDDGRVVVCLCRARTEDGLDDNDYIVVDEIRRLSKLSNKRVLRKHWRKIVVCMENTCLVSSPSFISRMKMLWLNLCFPYSEKGTIHSCRLWEKTKKGINYLIPVLFSGIGIALATFIYHLVNPSPQEIGVQNQKEIIKLLEQMDLKSNEIVESIKISNKLYEQKNKVDSLTDKKNKDITDKLIRVLDQSISINKAVERQIKKLEENK